MWHSPFYRGKDAVDAPTKAGGMHSWVWLLSGQAEASLGPGGPPHCEQGSLEYLQASLAV